MKIEKSFELLHPREMVWSRMNDVYLVARCLPGASIVEDLGEHHYKGRMSVKVGPMAAAFDGEVAIDSQPQAWTAIVSGKGADARSSSRATGAMTYRLSEGSAPAQPASKSPPTSAWPDRWRSSARERSCRKWRTASPPNSSETLKPNWPHPRARPLPPKAAYQASHSMPEICFGRSFASVSWRCFGNVRNEVNGPSSRFTPI